MGCFGLKKKLHRGNRYLTPRGSQTGEDTAFSGGLKATGSGRGVESRVSTRLSRALSDNEYFDAVEHHEGGTSYGSSSEESLPSTSGRGSAPDVGVNGHANGPSHDSWAGNLIHRLSGKGRRSGRRHTNEYHSNSLAGYNSVDIPVSAASAALDDPAEEGVIAPEPPPGGLAACLPFISASSGPMSPQVRFLRTSTPQAGSSLKRYNATHPGQDSQKFVWVEPDTTAFMVRGKDYMRTKQKVRSSKAFYHLIDVDVYSFDFKIHHVAKHVQLPPSPTVSPEAAALPPDKQLPTRLIINVQLPTYPASLFGSSDGPGFSIVYYFALPEGWTPNDVEHQEALDLLRRFFADGRESDHQKTRDRLKLIARVVNVDEWAREAPLSMPEHRLLTNYNDKPLLTKPQHRFYAGQDYFEIDLDIHSYAYLARKAFSGFIPRLSTVVFENAFVVQGNRSEELPEVIIGAARLYRIDFMQPRPFPATLARTKSGKELAVPPGSP